MLTKVIVFVNDTHFLFQKRILSKKYFFQKNEPEIRGLSDRPRPCRLKSLEVVTLAMRRVIPTQYENGLIHRKMTK